MYSKDQQTLEEKQADNIQNGLPKNAGLSWTSTEKEDLVEKFKSNVSIDELSEIHGRTRGAITS